MIAISDTSPLNYLLLIDHIALLPQIYEQVIIPEAVYRELSHPGAPKLVAEWISTRPTWAEVRIVSRVDTTVGLGRGESEAISLAMELSADVLLMDERKGRREARARGITVIGTLNILEEASARGMVSLPDAIARLQQTSFRASPAVFREILRRESVRVKEIRS
jgi:predicted nucleic acid-binding protein